MTTQMFFRSDDGEAAYRAHKTTGRALFAVVDRRPKKPKPLMFIVGTPDEVVDAQLRMSRSGMWKRMWRYKLVSQ